MSKKLIKEFRSRQQVKDKQINYLLADVEKNLEEYKIALELKEKQLSDAKKYCFQPSKVTIKQLLKIESKKHI